MAYLRHSLGCSAAACNRDVPTGRGRAGFTLVEILIVAVLIGIAALVVVPLAGSTAGVQIRSAANMIASDLEYAKSMAISRGQAFSVVFDKNTETYRIEDQAGNVVQHPVRKGFDYVVNLHVVGLDKVDIFDADFDSTGEVRFDYLGSPYNGSNNPLNSGVVTLQAGSIIATISVEPVTGFISTQN